MRIATYHVNGIASRLPVLLRWLELRGPDVVCLQELKAPDETFPEQAFRDSDTTRSSTASSVGTASPPQPRRRDS